MAQIPPLNPKSASAEVQAVFTEIEQAFGMIPNLFKTAAHFPPLLSANWEMVKAVMMSGQLSRRVKETIALVVSQKNGCQYCVQAHTQALRGLKLSEEAIHSILQGDLSSAGFDDKAVAVIQFAQAVNTDPHQMPDSIWQDLERTGVSAAERVEALGVVETFVGFNLFLDALQVEIDF